MAPLIIIMLLCCIQYNIAYQAIRRSIAKIAGFSDDSLTGFTFFFFSNPAKLAFAFVNHAHNWYFDM